MMLVAMEKMRNALYLCKVGRIRKTGNTTWLNQPQNAIMLILMCSCVFAVVFANSHEQTNNILFNNKRSVGFITMYLHWMVWSSHWTTSWLVVVKKSVIHDDVIKWKHFRITCPLWGEFFGYRWILLTKACDGELWCFVWSTPEQTVEETLERLVVWDAIAPIMTSL